MIEPHPFKRKDWIILLLVLLIAGMMRFGMPGIVEFFHDDAMVATMALEMAEGVRFPFTGIISSTGIPNTPISIYLMAIPFAISSDPSVAIGFIMALNVAGVGLLWALAHRYFGRNAGLVAGLTYAISPWAVLFSRKIWAQDFHTPFILLGLLLALVGFWERPSDASKTRRTLAQAFALPVFLIGVQIHFAAVALLPLVIIVAVYGRRQIQWRAATVSVALAVLVLLPYLIGLTQTLQDDPARISDAATRSADSGLIFSGESLLDAVYLATGYGMETWVAPEQQAEFQQAVPASPLWSLIGFMMLIGAGVLLWRKRHFAALVLCWGLLPPLLLVPQWTDVYVHYFIASIPAYALLAGIGTALIARIVPLQPTGQTIILMAYGIILLTQAMWWRGMLRFVDTVEIAYPGYTTPLHQLDTVREAVLPASDVVVLSYGMSWSLHHESVVWSILLHDDAQCTRTLIDNGYAVFPAQPFTVVVAPDAPRSGNYTHYTHDEGELISTRDGAIPYEIYAFDAPPDWWGPEILPVDDAQFDNDVTLTGYALADDTVYLAWELPDGSRSDDYQYSAQLFTADGERITQLDKPFWHGRHWCTGDRLVTWGTLAQVPDAAELRVSMYQLAGNSEAPDFIPANVLDEAGNPAGQQAVIPLD